MKKEIQLLFILCLIFSTSALAQNPKKGIQAFVVASPFPTETNNQNDFGLLAMAGAEFFVTNTFSFSGNFFTSNNTLFKNNSDLTIHSYGFLPTIQYYFIDKSKFSSFGMLGYGFGFEDQTIGIIENNALSVFGVGIGGNYWFTNKMALKLIVPYFNAKNLTINTTAVEGVALFIGFNYKL